jgi:hypothetical protein
MSEQIILLTKQGWTIAENPAEIRYYAEPEVVTLQPDGSEIITRAKCTGAFTPDGKPVESKYRLNTFGGTGYWKELVDGKKYQGLVIINMGPDTEVDVRPKWRPYDPSNSGTDRC